jgi:hypothetical protein
MYELNYNPKKDVLKTGSISLGFLQSVFATTSLLANSCRATWPNGTTITEVGCTVITVTAAATNYSAYHITGLGAIAANGNVKV